MTEHLELSNPPGKRAKFTYDVVYSLAKFAEALNIDEKRVCACLDVSRGHFKDYIVLNAREQCFVLRHGITNGRILKYLKEQKEASNSMLLNCLRNCFSMLDANGKTPTPSVIAIKFMGQFTPEFYPMRYALKDDLYSQYLDVLDVLLNHVLDVYYEAGVRYVEFSAGIGDLITRPWVFRRLFETQEAYHHTHPDVTFRFLAAFDRRKSPSLKELASKLKEGEKLKFENLPNPFAEETYHPSFLEDLAKVNEVMKYEQAQELIVGLDYVGNEEDHPYCPFGLEPFTEFLLRCRKEFNPRFGFRFHCGEISAEGNKFNLLHMAISGVIITAILKAFETDPPPVSPVSFPLRIGHGVAFLDPRIRGYLFMDDDDLKNSAFEIKQCLAKMHKWKVPIEVNLKSNEILLQSIKKYSKSSHSNPNPMAVHVFRVDYNLPVVLCTDDDGIFEVLGSFEGEDFRSVAGEYAKSLAVGTISSKKELVNLIGFGQDAKFS